MKILIPKVISDKVSIGFTRFLDFDVLDVAEQVSYLLTGVMPSSVFEEVYMFLKARKKDKSFDSAKFRRDYFEARRKQRDDK